MYQITRLKVFLAGLLLFPALATFVSMHLVAQEKPPSPFPVPEMQRLSKLYIGRWEYTETYPKSAFFPNGGVNTGVYVSEPGPGGNSIFNHFHSKGAEGDFDGTLVMTWDPLEKAYKAYVFGDSFPGCDCGNRPMGGRHAGFSPGIFPLVKPSLRYATRQNSWRAESLLAMNFPARMASRKHCWCTWRLSRSESKWSAGEPAEVRSQEPSFQSPCG